MGLPVELYPVELPVVLGELARARVRISNDGRDARRVRVEVGGAAAGWAWTNPAETDVPPGQTAEVRVMFRPPHGSVPPAGPLPVVVRAVPAAGAGATAEATLILNVAATADISAVLQPAVAIGRRTAGYTLVVGNRGNRPERVALTAAGSSGDVRCDLDPATVEVAAGDSVCVQVTATSRATTPCRHRRRRHRGCRRTSVS